MESEIKAALAAEYKVLEQERVPTGIIGKSFGGKNLLVIQSEVLAGVQSIIVTEGRMATRLRGLLDQNLTILQEAVASLEPDAAEYFTRILAMAKKARACCLESL
jgi:hypothetical protein